MASSFAVPQLDFPLYIGPDGTFGEVEQDSLDDVCNSVIILVSTRVGEREDLPTYGIPDPTFSQGVDTSVIVDAIAEWEPRATVNITSQIDSMDEFIAHIETIVEVNDGG